MQQAIAHGTMMMIVGLVVSLPRTGLLRYVGPPAVSALGVFVLLTTGIVSLPDVAGGAAVLWRPFITILSIMLTTSVAHRLGLLEHLAGFLAPRSGRSVGRVFCSVFILSAGTSAVLNNDSAVLLLRPLIVGLVRRCEPERPDLIVPFAFAVFSAAGVAPLVISNPMNLIVAEYAGIGFNEYAARMIPISVVGWLTTYAILRLIFRRQLNSPRIGVIAGPPRPVLSRPAKQFGGLVLVALGCYPALSYGCGPVWAVAAVSAMLGVGLCWHHNIASPRRLIAGLSWETLIFLFCIFIIVLGLRNVGLVDRVAELYSSATSEATKIVVIGISSAVGSAILNNHPMAIVNALAIHNLPQASQSPLLAALIGGDLGPRLLPMGSLAGLLWLDSFAEAGCPYQLLSLRLCWATRDDPNPRTISVDIGSRYMNYMRWAAADRSMTMQESRQPDNCSRGWRDTTTCRRPDPDDRRRSGDRHG
jgi:arsenical pump membrane protein